jgi:hypothetical protein
MSLLKSAAWENGTAHPRKAGRSAHGDGLDEHGGVIERTRRAEAERVILGKSR